MTAPNGGTAENPQVPAPTNTTVTDGAASTPRVGGRTHYSEKAVTRVITAATRAVPGTVEVGRTLERIASRSFPRFDVLIDQDRGLASIEAYIAVGWPSPVTSVAEAVRSTITEWVQAMTGLDVDHVNVVVGSVVSGERRVTQTFLDAHPLDPEITPVYARELPTRHPEVRPVSALRSTQRELSEIKVTPLKPTADIEVRPNRFADIPVEVKDTPHTDRKVTVPEEQPLKKISVPEEQPLKAVSAPEEIRTIEPKAPDFADRLIEVSVPLQKELKPITVREPRVVEVSEPPEWPLKPIEVIPLSRFSSANQKGVTNGRVH